MSAEPPTASTPMLRRLPLDPAKNVSAGGRNVTGFVPWWRGYDSAYATYLLWPPHTVENVGTLKPQSTITLFLTTRTSTLKITKVFSGLCVNCDGVTYDGDGSQMYDPAVQVSPGEYKKFVVPVEYYEDRPLAPGDQLRIFVNANVAVTSGVPEIFLAYGSPVAPSGVWMRGILDPKHPGTTQDLWFRDFGVLSAVAPTEASPKAAPCPECNLVNEFTISLGRYVFPEDLRVNGDPSVEFWMRRHSAQVGSFNYGDFVVAITGIERQVVELVVNGKVVGRSGEAMSLQISYWAGPAGDGSGWVDWWAMGAVVGLALDQDSFKAGDLFFLQLRVTAQEAAGQRGLAVLFDSPLTPTGVSFGVLQEPYEPRTKGTLRALPRPFDAATTSGTPPEDEPSIPGLGRGVLGYEGVSAMILSVAAFAYSRFGRR
ncbi:MAG: hypothetical protein HYT80_05740 [Euryarchaeota archaeon]|nr:hypothetical protein [Euryarchaeota archaeon]